MPPNILENLVILCFEKRFSKQYSVIRLKSKILPPNKFLPPPQFFGWLRHWLFAPLINISGYAPDTRSVKKRSCELYRSVVTEPELPNTVKLSVFKSVFVPISTYGHKSKAMTENALYRVKAQRWDFCEEFTV